MKKKCDLVYKKIERISPSQYGSMKNCSYKSILAKALDQVPQLPISPNAYLGTVIHKVLERIVKDSIYDEAELNNVFSEELFAMEEKLKNDGYDFFVPLQKNVKDFGVRKILLKKYIRKRGDENRNLSSFKVCPERWVSTRDNLVGGYVDLILESKDYTELIDFKTGAITNDMLDDSGDIFTVINPDYVEQIKLYAYAYFETKGRYPNKLTLIDLSNQRFDIVYTPEECEDLFRRTKVLLSSVNSSIESGDFQAVVSEDNCKYCLYRPCCNYYNSYIEKNPPFNDLFGLLESCVQHQNGNITLVVKNSNGLFSATGKGILDRNRLIHLKGQKIGVYNLRKESKENVYTIRKTTIIYEQ